MQVTVKQEHIQRALDAYEVTDAIETCCPIAQALTEARPDLDWHVIYKGGWHENGFVPFSGYVVGEIMGVEMERYELSQRACRNAYWFDRCDHFEPSRFRLRPQVQG